MTSGRWSIVAVAALLSAALVASVATPTAAADDVDRQRVSSGVFGDAQALAGEAAFAVHCAACHGAALGGGFGPALLPLDPWQFRDAPLVRLFDLVRTEMPFDAPGSLALETYLDLVAYLLRENGYPSGGELVQLTEDAVATLWLDDVGAE